MSEFLIIIKSVFCIFWSICEIIYLLLPWSGDDCQATGSEIDLDPSSQSGLDGIDTSGYSKSDREILAMIQSAERSGNVQIGGIHCPRFSSIH